MHLGKTESIIFGSRASLKQCSSLNIECNGVKIESNTFVKYLGSTLDQTLSGVTVANNLIKKVNGRLKFMYRKQSFLDCNVRKILANAIIQPHLDYACSSWYHGQSEKLKNNYKFVKIRLFNFV